MKNLKIFTIVLTLIGVTSAQAQFQPGTPIRAEALNEALVEAKKETNHQGKVYFRAQGSRSVTWTTANRAPVLNLTAIEDPSHGWNGTNTYIIPRSGVYIIIGYWKCSSTLSPVTSVDASAHLVTSKGTFEGPRLNQEVSWRSREATMILQLNLGDTVKLAAEHYVGTNITCGILESRLTIATL